MEESSGSGEEPKPSTSSAMEESPESSNKPKSEDQSMSEAKEDICEDAKKLSEEIEAMMEAEASDDSIESPEKQKASTSSAIGGESSGSSKKRKASASSAMGESSESKKRIAEIRAMLESNQFDDSLVPLYPSPFQWRILPRPEEFPGLDLYFHTDLMRIAVLDIKPDDPQYEVVPPTTAAMIVPRYQETDWIFCTEAGHVQFLAGMPGVSRFILIGNDPRRQEYDQYKKPEGDSPEFYEKLEQCLYNFLLNFLPKISIEMEEFHIRFFRYGHNLINSEVLGRLIGPYAGRMLIEDIEIENGGRREFRRRLRFERTPLMTQTEVMLVPAGEDLNPESHPDLSDLAQPHLSAMAAGLALAGGYLQSIFFSNIRPRILLLGAGGGSLLGFLESKFQFNVAGIEIDPVVMSAAKNYFALQESRTLRNVLGDAIELMKLHKERCDLDYDYLHDDSKKVDVLLVDLDPPDLSDLSVPPWTFLHEDVIGGVRRCLRDAGVLIVNVIPPTRVDLELLVIRLRQEFVELYRIDTGKGRNCVLVGTTQEVDLSQGFPENEIMAKIRTIKAREFLEKIVKI